MPAATPEERATAETVEDGEDDVYSEGSPPSHDGFELTGEIDEVVTITSRFL